MYSDSEQEPRPDTDSAWQEQSPPEGTSLSASYTSTPLEEDITPNNEIDGLLDNLDDMIDRSPAAPLKVPRARHNLAVELDRTRWTSLRPYVCSKRPSPRGPSDFPSGTS